MRTAAAVGNNMEKHVRKTTALLISLLLLVNDDNSCATAPRSSAVLWYSTNRALQYEKGSSCVRLQMEHLQ